MIDGVLLTLSLSTYISYLVFSIISYYLDGYDDVGFINYVQ